MGVPQGIRLTSASTTMQRTKSPSSSKSKRIIQNWWKGKSAPSSPCGAGKGFWLPEADNTWCNTKNKIVLSPTSLLLLTEVERVALQKIALARLQDINLGVPITIPKDGMNTKSKKSRFLLKRRAVSTNVIDTLSPTSPKNSYPPNPPTDSRTSGWVFGIPLAKCIANDIELRRLEAFQSGTRPTEMTHSPLRNRKSSSSSGGALSNDESLSESDCSRTTGSNLVDALLLPVSARLGSNRSQQQQTPPQVHPQQQQHLQMHPSDSMLRVPYVVNVCCQHLQTHGLGVLGIFRIGSSKKRTIQLRDEFDTGQEVKLTEEHNPHDVGAVLKEFFRDLPDPLLTKNLYSAFVATRKLRNDPQRIRTVNLLIALLPPSNRDTLWALLSFLNLIAKHSTDFVDDQGNKVPGNKMDAHNLATLFGPNILHKAKGGAFQVESLERAEERAEVISVVKEMIEHQADIFELSADLHDETLRDLLKTRPEDVDCILQCRTINFSIDPDPESSSSVCEESDTSSMPPHSPGYSSETDGLLYPRSFPDAAFHPPSSSTGESRTLIELLQSHASSSSTPSLPSIAIGIATPSSIARPPASGFNAAPRSAGATDRGGPAGRRKPHPEMRIEITTTEEDERPSRSSVPHIDDWSNGSRRTPHGSRAEAARWSSTSAGGKRQTLTVPTKYSAKDSDSSSGLSPRTSPRSSRSPSSSSPSPEPLWFQGGSGSSSPDQGVSSYCGGGGDHQATAASLNHPPWSSSSKHRPLGLSSELCGSMAASTGGGLCSSLRQPTASTASSAETSPDWQETRWTGWGRMGKQKGDELQEQETLV